MKIWLTVLLFLKRVAKAILPRSLYDWLRRAYHNHFVSRAQGGGGRHAGPDGADLPFGVNLFSYYTNNSAGSETRLLMSALEAGNIPYQCIDLNDPEKFNAGIGSWRGYKVNLIKCHAASGTPERLKLFAIDLKQYYNIGYWAWELPVVPDEYCAGLDIFQEMWTISGFCTNALEKKTLAPVLTVPLCANPDRAVIPNSREHFGFKKEPFLFMFAYDCASFVSRKNPQAAVEAFMKAFSPEDEHVGLILKLISPERDREHLKALQKTLSPYKNIYYIDRFLPDEEMRSLIQASDAFVSLHRSEGFGLLPLEAMSLGTPVISTAWSGNMEYMTHMNTALVDYTMVPVNGEYVGSVPGDGIVWAEADTDCAAGYMRRLVSDSAWREKLVAGGKHTADEFCTKDVVGKIMRDRLDFLAQARAI